MSLRTLWYYLTSYSSALTALASLVGVVLTFLAVVVAAVYAFLTWQLAKAAKIQADASLKGAEAAGQQAKATQLIFEAAHRPYLDVVIQPWSFYARPDFFDFAFLLTNKGPVPAILVACHAIVRLEGAVVAERPPDQRDAAVALFPGGEPEELVFKRGSGQIIPLQGNLELECRVEYRGFHEARYVTRIVARRTERGWKHVDMEIR